MGVTVDPDLAKVVAAVESGGSGGPNAIRFELGVYTSWAFDAAMKKSQAANGYCSDPTARMICATSWGRFQILGYNLYFDGYGLPIVSFAGNAADQTAAFTTFLSRRAINWSWAELCADQDKAKMFVTKYNGPAGWPVYWESMVRAAVGFGFTRP